MAVEPFERVYVHTLPWDYPQPIQVRSAGDLLGATGLLTAGDDRRRCPTVEIGGDRWSGKSALLNGVARAAAEHGWTVASECAAPSSPGGPCAMFVEALDDLLVDYDIGLLGGRPHDHVRWLAGAFPALAGAAPPKVAATPAEQYHVLRAIRALIGSLATHCGGLLLVLDDVHWADESSRQLLAHLLRHPVDGKVAIVFAQRTRQADRSLSGAMTEGIARGENFRVVPAPLTEAEALALLPNDISRAQCETLMAEAEGNPGLLRAFAALRAIPGRSDNAPSPMMPDLLAETLRDFRSLSEPGRRVAHAAAVLHEPIEPAALAEVAALTADELGTGVDELVREDIVLIDEYPWRLRFRNPLLRAAAYHSAGPGWLLGAHAQAAATAERRGDILQLAWHLERSAAVQDEASRLVLLAAAERQLWHDPAQAAAWAWTATNERDTPNGRTCQERLLLGRALQLSGQLNRSLETLEELKDCHEQDADTWVEGVRLRAEAWRLLGRPETALAELDAAARIPAPRDRSRQLALRRARLVHLLETRADPGPVVPSTLLGGDVVARPVLHGQTLAMLAAIGAEAGETGRARDTVATAARLLADQPGDFVEEYLDGVYWLGRAEAALGDTGSACARLECGLRIAEDRKLHSVVPRFAMALGALQLGRGDLADAGRHAECARVAAAWTDGDHLLEQASLLCAAVEAAETGGRARARPCSADRRPADAAAPGALVDRDGTLDTLSTRETEIAVLVSGGRTNQQIAHALELSHKTVETYLGRIFKKLVVSSRAEVAAMVGRTQS